GPAHRYTAGRFLAVAEPRRRDVRHLPFACPGRRVGAAVLRLPPRRRRRRRDGQAGQGLDPGRVPEGPGRGVNGSARAEGESAPARPSKRDALPTPNPTRPYSIPGFRIALVREPG